MGEFSTAANDTGGRARKPLARGGLSPVEVAFADVVKPPGT